MGNASSYLSQPFRGPRLDVIVMELCDDLFVVKHLQMTINLNFINEV